MPGKALRTVGTNGSSRARYLVLPRAWCDGAGVSKGCRVEVLYDDVLVVIPKPGRQAERVRRALDEEG
jgi:hypothetical protein